MKLFLGKLLTIFCAALILSGVGLSGVVHAQCVEVNDTTNCSGIDPDGHDAGNGIDTILVLPGATVNSTLITNNGNDTVIVYVNGLISTLLGADGIRMSWGANTVTNNGTIQTTTGGDGIIILSASTSTITNNGSITTNAITSEGMEAQGNNNTLVNNGSVTTTDRFSEGMRAQGDNNTLVNNGSVTTNNLFSDGMEVQGSGNVARNNGSITVNGGFSAGMYATGGNGLLINNGTIKVNDATSTAITTTAGNDNVSNSGSISAAATAINTGAGNDTVTLAAGRVDGLIDGGADTDALVFALEIGPEHFDEIVAAIMQANPNGGTVTIGSATFTWTNFENLYNQLRMAIFHDGRLNSGDIAATVVVYRAPGGDGVDLYALTGPNDSGEFAIRADLATLRAALAKATATGQNQLVGERLGVSLWALNSNELQAMGPNGYIYLFTPYMAGIE